MVVSFEKSVAVNYTLFIVKKATIRDSVFKKTDKAVILNGEAKMGKKTYVVDGHLYLLDDETGKVKEVIIKDTNIPPEVYEKLLLMVSEEKKS